MVKAKLKRKKKKWFEIKAKIEQKDVIIGEILTYELNSLIGRKITVNYGQISGNIRDQKTKIEFKITETKGSEGIAEPQSIYYQNSFIDQRIKRDRSRNLLVIKEKTKDNKEVKMKFIFSAKNKINRSVNSALLKNLENNFRELINVCKSEKLFNRGFIEKETAIIKEKARKIYPIDKVYVWKLSLI